MGVNREDSGGAANAARVPFVIADRWGVRDDEVARHYPCDDFLARPTLSAWRGVIVHAPAERLWQWIGQIRFAPYSYDWIDNLGRRAPQELRGLPEPTVGERFTIGMGRPAGRIVAVTPGAALTATILGAFMSYVIVPEAGGNHLLLKVVAGGPRLLAPFVSVGDLVMARRQLLNIKRLAEASPRRRF